MIVELIVLAYCLDLLCGDPRWLPHPVVLLGQSICWLEKLVRCLARTPKGLKWGGGFLFCLVVLGAYGITWGLIWLVGCFYTPLVPWVTVFLLYTTLSTKSLAEAAKQVMVPLQAGNLPEARKYLGYIVGRDTDQLEEGEITRGVVETVAENTMDGIISPLFYAFLGGAPLAMAYKAVNTLDSMVGYKDERFLYIGCVSAKLDDLANYVPARITGILLLISAFFLRLDWQQGLSIWRRDAKKHPSPNGGIPESIVAGALGIRLGGYNSYYGKSSFRAYMGDLHCPLCFRHIEKTIRLMQLTSLLGIIIGSLLLAIIK